jgi:hypothetical protein
VKLTSTHKVLAAAVAVTVLLALTFLLHDRLQGGGPWDGPLLKLHAGSPPLIQFEKLSIHDPGLYRIILRTEGEALPRVRDHLNRVAEITGGTPLGNPPAIVRVWDHEPVIELRIALTTQVDAFTGRSAGPSSALSPGKPLSLRVHPLGRTFDLSPQTAEPVRLRVRDLVSDPASGSVFLTLANVSDALLTFDGLRLNARVLDLPDPISIPVHRQARVRIHAVDGPDAAAAADLSIVVESQGRWVQACEVAATPPFFINEWHASGENGLNFDAAGVLQRHGGAVIDIEDDYPSADRQTGLPLGSHLGRMRDALLAVSRRGARATADGADSTAAGPHAFAVLGEGYRPASHYVYGRLSDFVGVKGFDVQLFKGTPQDVLYWINTDRRIVEPRHILAIPGVFSYRREPRRGLDALGLQRLVLTMLAVAPKGLLYFQGDDSDELYGYRSDTNLKTAIGQVNGLIRRFAADLRFAMPVNWVYRKEDGQMALDTSGRTGIFTLFSGSGRLIVISLGYGEPARIRLPDGVALRRVNADPPETAAGVTEASAVPLPAAPHPTMKVHDLTLEYRGDGDVSWILF